MRTFRIMDAIEHLLKSSGKYGCFLSITKLDDDDVDDVVEMLPCIKNAAPLLSNIDAINLFVDGKIFVEFDTEDEAQEFFKTVVGDDGPTKTNSYDGPVRVFAVWGGPDGWLSENT